MPTNLQELFLDKSKWIKGHLAIDINKCPTLPENEISVAWCLWGGILKCYPYPQRIPVMQKIVEAIDNIWETVDPSIFDEQDMKYIIIKFNDNQYSYFEDIRYIIEWKDI